MKIKTITFLLFLLIFCKHALSQHLSYNDLLTLQSINTEKCEEILSLKGFVLNETNYDEETKKTRLVWKYQNLDNEMFVKNCSNLFARECEEISYITNNETTFINIKKSLKSGFNIYAYSDTKEGVLRHHYLIGNYKSLDKSKSREVVLSTFIFKISKRKYFAIKIDEITGKQPVAMYTLSTDGLLTMLPAF